ncbi:NAD-dependent epimerase/dehydratase family protein [Kitasatospora phosalacinea]|uniref:NAD-dependent epimerase/dehydratase family protein n=1 Tax=Kitasatospora phosalacinea TaxID=2065 RepID=UPI0036669004
MRVLVTGASGYVGQAVMHRLAAAGFGISVLRHRTDRPWGPSVRVHRGDILQTEVLRESVRGVDAVCHLAAVTTVRDASPGAAEHQRRVILDGTRNLLDAVRREGERRGRPLALIHFSTSAVYGLPAAEPLRTAWAAAPRSPYGAAKLQAEREVGAEAATGALGAVCFRLFNAAGRSRGGGVPSPQGLIPRAVAVAVAVAAGRSGVLRVYGDGSAMRDFVHVDDVAEAVVSALPRAVPGTHAVHNLGATPAGVLEVVRVAEQVCGRRLPVEYLPPAPLDSPYLVADTTRTREELGWEPRYSCLTRLVTEEWRATRERR